MTTRVMVPSAGALVTVNGRTYRPGQSASTLDVPDGDAVALASAGWPIVGTVGIGPAARPVAPVVMPVTPPHLDLTNPSTPVPYFFDGAVWRDHTGKPK